LFRKYKQAATGVTAANGYQATGLFPCAIKHLQTTQFPSGVRNTDTAPVNHPALVKTSDQASFCSSNFSLFISADALQLSYISPVPSLN
jgi:hypothetical protein